MAGQRQPWVDEFEPKLFELREALKGAGGEWLLEGCRRKQVILTEAERDRALDLVKRRIEHVGWLSPQLAEGLALIGLDNSWKDRQLEQERIAADLVGELRSALAREAPLTVSDKLSPQRFEWLACMLTSRRFSVGRSI
jgi:hypothetical protein